MPRRWNLVAVPLIVAGLASPLSCRHTEEGYPTAPGATGPGGIAPTCDELKTGDFSTLVFGGPTGTGDNVKLLLARSLPLARTAAGLEKELIDACTELGLAAGLEKGDLEASPDAGHGAEKACNVAASRVAAMFRKAKESRTLLDVQMEPTRCFVDATAARKCLAECGSPPPPKADLRAHCIAGEITGVCSGRCSGTCALPPAPRTGPVTASARAAATATSAAPAAASATGPATAPPPVVPGAAPASATGAAPTRPPGCALDAATVSAPAPRSPRHPR